MSARPASLTTSADLARAIPRSVDEREWVIEAALASLEQEERRLAALGFEVPLARCRDQRRFWEFVRAIHALDRGAAPPAFRSVA